MFGTPDVKVELRSARANASSAPGSQAGREDVRERGGGAPTHYNGIGNESEDDVERVLCCSEGVCRVGEESFRIWPCTAMNTKRLIRPHEGQNLVL